MNNCSRHRHNFKYNCRWCNPAVSPTQIKRKQNDQLFDQFIKQLPSLIEQAGKAIEMVIPQMSEQMNRSLEEMIIAMQIEQVCIDIERYANQDID